jgi:DNA-binding CsgD family transcriptional regulator
MNWDAFLNGAMGAGVLSIILKLIDVYNNRNKTRADAAKVIVEGGAAAVAMMKVILDEQDKVNDERFAENEKFKAQLAERDRASHERDAQLADLQQKHEDLEAELIKTRNLQRETDEKYRADLQETQRLRNEYAILTKQNLRLEELAIGLAESVNTIKQAIQNAKIELKLNGELDELMESVYRIKAERAERGKQ